MTTQEKAQEALSRAQNPYGSTRNYMAIITGFVAKGIPADDIRPRENVLTFWAWKAVGRRVRKGEHGVKVQTYIECEGRKHKGEAVEHAEEQTEQKPHKPHKPHKATRPWTTTVFHVSQTDPIKQ